MGREARLNIGIKNDRIKILEKRADMVETLLNQRIEIFIKLAGELREIVDALLKQEIYEIKLSQELIYEELISRTVRGRFKRLAAWLAGKKRKP